MLEMATSSWSKSSIGEGDLGGEGRLIWQGGLEFSGTIQHE